ncbi:hypothetical protein JOD20_004127 [Herpetosiphon giganteus]|nr:hypothetical protein [Herpetosiphon giganteus]
MHQLIYQAEPAGFCTFQKIGVAGLRRASPSAHLDENRVFTGIPQFGWRL